MTANVTNIVPIWPGYPGTAVRLRGELSGQRPRVIVLRVTCIVGAVAGTALLLPTPSAWFRRSCRGCAVAAALVALQARLTEHVRALPGGAGEHGPCR